MVAVLKDYAGREIRLTDEREQHILERPEMQGLEAAIGDTLAHPEAVIRSLSDSTVWLRDKGSLLDFVQHDSRLKPTLEAGRKKVCVSFPLRHRQDQTYIGALVLSHSKGVKR